MPAKGDNAMPIPIFPIRRSPRSATAGFFETHAVVDVIRSLALSSVMWLLLAGSVYTIYSVIVGTH